jgi:glutathione S-transferase
MKLYYSPGACSLSPHIVLREAGMKFDLEKTALKTHTLVADGSDYYAIAPKGQVPMLELDDGQRLTEGPVIVQYIADRAPASGLAPAAGTMERYRLMEWLNFVTSELHKGFSPLFNAQMPQEAKEIFAARLKDKFGFVDKALAGREYLMGAQFTVADAYLYTVATWADPMGIDLSGLADFAAWRTRVSARPAVQAALVAEGLRK